MSGGWTPPAGSNASARVGVGGLARIVLARALRLVRSDKDLVIWPRGELGGGNHLYMWCYAWQAKRHGRRVRVLRQPGMDAWIEEFPALEELTISRDDVRFFQAREPEIWGQVYSDIEDIDGFIRGVLLSSERFTQRLEQVKARQSAKVLTVNVRRGDYYTNDEFAQCYGMDLDYYFDLVRQSIGDSATYDSVLAVSDDPQWCKAHLGTFFDDAQVDLAPSQGMFDDLATLAAADSVVLANSTFSYWGGYINEVFHGRRSSVWAPNFHWNYGPGTPAAWHLSPTWRIVDNLDHELTRLR